jgi:hypothetical protein
MIGVHFGFFFILIMLEVFYYVKKFEENWKTIFFLLFLVLGLELRVLWLLGKCSTTLNTLPVLFCFQIGSHSFYAVRLIPDHPAFIFGLKIKGSGCRILFIIILNIINGKSRNKV